MNADRFRARHFLAGAVLLIALPVATAQAQEAARPELIVTYRTSPADWQSFRDAIRSEALPRLEAWKTAGVLSSYRVLFNRHVDAQTWNAMAVLRFAGARGEARWRALERTMPAALTKAERALTTSIETTPVDGVREGAAKADPAAPVFLAIPYRYMVSDSAYRKYLDGYTIPQLQGWIAAGVLSRYEIVMASYPAGRPWTAMLLLEYSSDAALARRDEVKDKVRARLAHIPSWKAIADDKTNIRAELALTVADDASQTAR